MRVVYHVARCPIVRGGKMQYGAAPHGAVASRGLFGRVPCRAVAIVVVVVVAIEVGRWRLS